MHRTFVHPEGLLTPRNPYFAS
ncbi:hypothetical protein RSAG8_13816, partial [Rhizoctonia solani AG-8 WAC10335]